MESASKASFVDISELTGTSARLSAATLIMQSLPPYYEASGIDGSEIATAVAQLIGARGTELERGFAATCGDEVVGILTHLASASLPKARLVGTQALLKRLSAESARQFREHLKSYDAGFGDIAAGSLYLARFAVTPRLRGSGLAGQMMHRFLSAADVLGVEQGQFSLHVDRDNARAIGFYRKHGFSVSHSGSRYLTMVCSPDRQN